VLRCAILRLPVTSPSRIFFGTAGWSYKDWEGIVYPALIKKSQHPVEYMARYFDMLQINTSFYGHVKPEWGKLWCHKARAANPRFLFTAKLNRALTHSPVAIVESTSAETIHIGPNDEPWAKAGFDSIAEEKHARGRGYAVSHLVQEHRL